MYTIYSQERPSVSGYSERGDSEMPIVPVLKGFKTRAEARRVMFFYVNRDTVSQEKGHIFYWVKKTGSYGESSTVWDYVEDFNTLSHEKKKLMMGSKN